MKKLYYIKTNGYDMVASQEDGVVKYITESEAPEFFMGSKDAMELLKSVEDDTSWNDDITQADLETIINSNETDVCAELNVEL